MGTRAAVTSRALRLALIGMAGTSVAAGEAMTREQDGPRTCLTIENDAARLACYDIAVRKLVAPSFSGRLNKTTGSFAIARPTLLRYQSDGAIFVLYLKAADGAVVQNLHIGGGGEATYLIEQPGTYFLDINGSESWRIWLESDPAQTTN